MKKFINDLCALKNALKYSVDGLKYLIKERAFKQELLFGVVLIIIELFRPSDEMVLYVFSAYFFILLSEALNSAIEACIDRISVEKHELSKKAKDIGSAAVFLAILHFSVVWCVSWFV